mgnify:FL=1
MGSPFLHLRKTTNMPVYEYLCDSCGPFSELVSMEFFDKPYDCPDCATPAPRVMLTAPNRSFMSSSLKGAHATNERSADSPKRIGHGPGCSCCGSGKKINSGTLHRPDGSKSFPQKRPWMISH